MKNNGHLRIIKPSPDIRALENLVKSARAKWLSAREVYGAAWLEYEEAAQRLKDATNG